MIWRCLMDRTCCVATPKGPLISCSADAGVLTQPTLLLPPIPPARADLALGVGCGERLPTAPKTPAWLAYPPPGMGASPADKRQAANRIKAILNDLALLENSTCYVRRIKAR